MLRDRLIYLLPCAANTVLIPVIVFIKYNQKSQAHEEEP